MPLPGRILLIDDASSIPAHCRKALESSGFFVTIAESGHAGLEKVRQESFDAALLNLEIRDASGIDILARIKQESPNTAVIVFHRSEGSHEIEKAMGNGAFGCLAESCTPEVLIDQVLKAAGHSRRALEDSCIVQELDRMMLSQAFIGRSEAIRRIARFIQKAASVDSTVLLTGEPGTGKEVVARAIHRLSHRSNRRFVTVDCRKSVDMLLENELFGHFHGAITDAVGHTNGKIERAEGGTLFLDDIANIGGSTQEKLLGVILNKEISSGKQTPGKKTDVRILSATCQNMSRIVDNGTFREDLFYRLNSLHISIPPLRERLEDIPLLADYYIRKFAAENKRPAPALSDEVLRSLQRREWPGNVRELVQLLKHAAATCESTAIKLRDLPPESADLADTDNTGTEGYLARLEKSEILRILEQFQGNKTRAAKYLGINRKTLREKMERYNLNK